MQHSKGAVRALSAFAIIAFALISAIPALAQDEAGEAASEENAEATPTIVKIHADWCGKCAAMDPAWKRVEKELDEEARVVVFDVTDKKTTSESAALARELGFEAFFGANKSKTGLVAVFPPGETGEPSKVLVAETKFDLYREAVVAVTAGE